MTQPNPCADKKQFTSYQQAWKTLRKWRSAGRKFDDAHIYKCNDCHYHHIGRKHDAMKHGRVRRTAVDTVRETLLDEVDVLFHSQVQRIVGRLSRSERRIRNANRGTLETGPLVRPETATLAFSGDELDVHDKGHGR